MLQGHSVNLTSSTSDLNLLKAIYEHSCRKTYSTFNGICICIWNLGYLYCFLGLSNGTYPHCRSLHFRLHFQPYKNHIKSVFRYFGRPSSGRFYDGSGISVCKSERSNLGSTCWMSLWLGDFLGIKILSSKRFLIE